MRCLNTTAQVRYAAVIYSQFGEPSKVLKLVTTSRLSTEVRDNDVLVRMIAAPVNPSDINMIEGVYPIRPNLPAVGGIEGCGEVVEVGGSVDDLHKGDWVIPNTSSWGTWRTLAVCPRSEVIKIPDNIPLASAATMYINPCTAYRMLVDFVPLSAGDCVIQNGANSGVGQAVIQIAKAMNLQTINVIRAGRPDLNKLVAYLKDLGATHVITDEFLQQKQAMRELVAKLPNGPPRLGFNCVGGQMFGHLIKHIARQGVVVTYGGMAKQPLSIPTGPLVFNEINVCGFNLTFWNNKNRQSHSAVEMYNYVAAAIHDGILMAPLHRLVALKDFNTAIDKAMEPFLTEKQILIMND